jgi:hypothetical protein
VIREQRCEVKGRKDRVLVRQRPCALRGVLGEYRLGNLVLRGKVEDATKSASHRAPGDVRNGSVYATTVVGQLFDQQR